jgi:PhnB protein
MSSNAHAPYRSGTPLLAVHDAAAALDFYQRAFGARLTTRLDTPDGRVMHAALLFDDSAIVVVDEMPEVGLRSPKHYGGTPFSIIVACADAESGHARAVSAGARSLAPVQPDFSGARHGLVECPFGHRWILSSRIEELSADDIAERFNAWLAAGQPVDLER